MGFTKEQIAFFEKYEKQINELIEDDVANKRRDINEKHIKQYSFAVASLFMALAIFLYYLFKCKFVLSPFNLKYFVVEISFELAIWGFVFTFTDIILKKTRYRVYGYFISITVSLALSYIFSGLFEFELSDKLDKYSIIFAILSTGVFVVCFFIGMFRGTKLGKDRNHELHEMEKDYHEVFVLPRHYSNNSSINDIKKRSRKRNRKRK